MFRAFRCLRGLRFLRAFKIRLCFDWLKAPLVGEVKNDKLG